MHKHTQQFLEFLRENRGYVLTAFFILIFLLVLGLVTDTGQRLFSTLGITPSAEIELIVPHENVRVYLDGGMEARSTRENERITLSGLPVGTHSIIAARPQAYPWTKTIELEADEQAVLRPFLIAHNPDSRRIERSNDTYRSLVAQISSYSLPSEEAPLLSTDEHVAVWFTNEAIHARWLGDDDTHPAMFCPTKSTCLDTITVSPTVSPVKSINYYTDRNDVLVIAAQDSVYALEIGTQGVQNFQPLYEGDDPHFIRTGTSTIAVFDEGMLREFSL